MNAEQSALNKPANQDFKIFYRTKISKNERLISTL